MLKISRRVEIPCNPFYLKKKSPFVFLFKISKKSGGIKFFTAWIAGILARQLWKNKIRSGKQVQLDAYVKIGKKNKSFTITESNTQFCCIYSKQYRNLYEVDVEAALEVFLRKNDYFVDIGANWGYYGLKLALYSKKKLSIYCFEPSKRAYSDMDRIRNQIGLGSEFSGYNVALSDQTGTVQLVHSGIESGLATIGASNVHGLNGLSHIEKVQMVRLDDINIRGCAVVKIDVEGAELNVLKGAQAVISQFHPVIIFEHWYKQESIFSNYRKFFQNHNYRLYQIKGKIVGKKINEKIFVDLDLKNVAMVQGCQYHLVAFPKERELADYFT